MRADLRPPEADNSHQDQDTDERDTEAPILPWPRTPSTGAAALTGQVITVDISTLWHPGISLAELYNLTHGPWFVGARVRDHARYVLALADGLIRMIYRIESWSPSELAGDSKRWRFHGPPAEDLASYHGAPAAHYLQPHTRRPIRTFTVVTPWPT